MKHMRKDSRIFCLRTMAWQCFTEGYESLFQSSFADNNTLVLEGFVTVHEEKSLG